MATAHYLRLQIKERLLDERKVKAYIQSNWCAFAGIDPIDRLSYRVEEVGNEGQQDNMLRDSWSGQPYDGAIRYFDSPPSELIDHAGFRQVGCQGLLALYIIRN